MKDKDNTEMFWNNGRGVTLSKKNPCTIEIFANSYIATLKNIHYIVDSLN